jgi:hypothetical protein
VARQEQPTIAILGSNTLAEHALAHLLEGEGYTVRLLKAPPAGTPTLLPEGSSVDELLDGVDVVLLWPSPSLIDDVREAFLGAMRSSPTAAEIPALALSPTLEVALQDELAVDVPLERQFDYLARIIEAVLASPAGSVGFLDLAGLAPAPGAVGRDPQRSLGRHPALPGRQEEE